MVVSANISRYQQRFNMTEFRQSLEVGSMIIDHKSRFFEACVMLLMMLILMVVIQQY